MAPILHPSLRKTLHSLPSGANIKIKINKLIILQPNQIFEHGSLKLLSGMQELWIFQCTWHEMPVVYKMHKQWQVRVKREIMMVKWEYMQKLGTKNMTKEDHDSPPNKLKGKLNKIRVWKRKHIIVYIIFLFIATRIYQSFQIKKMNFWWLKYLKRNFWNRSINKYLRNGILFIQDSQSNLRLIKRNPQLCSFPLKSVSILNHIGQQWSLCTSWERLRKNSASHTLLQD